MKQPYLNEAPINKSNYKIEAANLMHVHDAGQLGFPGKAFSAKANTDKQSTQNKYSDDTTMLDIFGALNY
jgi:hypothetical protein